MTAGPVTAAEYRTQVAQQMREKALLEQVRAVAAVHGWSCYHPHRSEHSEPGWPDLVLARRGRVVFRELKTQRGRLTPDQQRWLDHLTAAGLDAGVWRPLDLLEGRIETHLRHDERKQD